MADPNARDAKLIQYLNEAYGKEKELETSLAAHIGMTTRPPYKKRLQQHLKETKGHGRELQRRIKALGGKAETVPLPDAAPDALKGAAQAGQEVINGGAALVKGQGHAIRGTGEQEKLLKNAKTQYFNEAEEIANYNAIETLATAVGDKETARLAKSIRREEERMQGFLERLIPQLTRAVATEEIPARERNSGTRRRKSGTRSASRSSSSRSTGGRKSGASSARKSGSRSTARKAGSGSTARKAGSSSKARKSAPASRSSGPRSSSRSSRSGSGGGRSSR